LDLTGEELQRLRQAVEVLRQAGEPGISQAVLARRALLTEVERVLSAGKRKGNGPLPKAAPVTPPAEDLRAEGRTSHGKGPMPRTPKRARGGKGQGKLGGD
jgi:hypothetical protein